MAPGPAICKPYAAGAVGAARSPSTNQDLDDDGNGR